MFLKAIPKSGAGIHLILLTTVMHAPQSFFDKTDSGITLNRFSQDMTLVDGTLPGAVIISLQGICAVTIKTVEQKLIVLALFNCFSSAALISLGSSYMALTIPVLFICLYLLQNVYLRTSRQMRHLDLEAKSPLYTNFLETLEGLSTIRAFGWEQRLMAVSNQRLDISQRPYYLMYCIQRWLNIVLQLLIGGMAVIVMGLAVSLRNSTSGGNLGIALTSILTFNTNVQFLLTWWTSLETSLGAIARTKNFAEQTPKEDRSCEVLVPASDWPAQGGIEFKNVSASYGYAGHIDFVKFLGRLIYL
jgi:ATP-binding cassette subfamily C (CFTR/MRP) protein 1